MTESKSIDNLRHLSLMLVFSVSFNIVALALLFYWISKESPPKPYCELKPAKAQEQMLPLAVNTTNEEMLRCYRPLPKEELIAKLADQELIENGYAKRDLALATLILFHHFDLSRALANQVSSLQERKISIGKNRQGKSIDATVFSGMSEEQYQAILQFAKTEKWPLTSRGLFFSLRKPSGNQDASLADSFFLTQEFEAVHLLFTRSGIQLEKKELLQVVLEGTWKQIKEFSSQQKVIQDLSPARRQRFLLDYIDLGSSAAAYLLLKTDETFAAKKLDDQNALKILKLTTVKTAESEQFALNLLTRPRSDTVWQLAAEKLYDFSGEPKPEKNIHHAALMHFVFKKPITESLKQEEPIKKIEVVKTKPTNPSKPLSPSKVEQKVIAKKSPSKSIPKEKVVNPSNQAPKIYVVQQGDSLWKIAKRFNVETQAIIKLNQLKSDALKPGTVLKLPPKPKKP